MVTWLICQRTPLLALRPLLQTTETVIADKLMNFTNFKVLRRQQEFVKQEARDKLTERR